MWSSIRSVILWQATLANDGNHANITTEPHIPHFFLNTWWSILPRVSFCPDPPFWSMIKVKTLGPLRNKLQRNFNRNSNISFQKMLLKMSSSKWRPFYLGLNVLIPSLTKFGLLMLSLTSWGNQKYITSINTPFGHILYECFIVLSVGDCIFYGLHK